ncbi:MAG: hypothetical protein Q9M19_01600 [Mariprofundaceae bacterium]|nr:hypothetical protein [Mariprofundaceae bacterium]
MKWSVLLFVLALTLLSACSGKHGLSLLSSSYETAVEDLKQGRVMEARTRILQIEKKHQDYKEARSFLRKKVNPARLKLLRYYARLGKKEEKRRHWAKAVLAYQTAAGLSIRPKALLRYQVNMVVQVRKLRAQSMYAQRKKEDVSWLKWLNDYNPPQGLLGDDAVFATALHDVESISQKRLRDTWALAQKYKRMDVPELTWVYADSYLRFAPSSKKAQDLKNAMATAIPQGFNLGKTTKKKKRVKSRKSKSKMSKQEVVKQMELNHWITARTYAHKLRRQGHSDADKLLASITAKTKTLAEDAYRNGNLAFRLERIDAAVSLWGKAVKWMPKEQAYIDALRRGKQIQERVRILKTEESAAERNTKVEE